MIGNNNLFRCLAGLFFYILCLTGCSSSQVEEGVIARVGTKKLYLKDVVALLPEKYSSEDSISFCKSYTEGWVKRQLLLNRAELNVNEKEYNIADKVEDYRRSLLVYLYESRMLSERLDTVVTVSEREAYYEQYSENFLLEEAAIKAVYVTISASAPDKDKFRKYLQSDKAEDRQKLEDYCQKHAIVYDRFKENWVLWSRVGEFMPDEEGALKEISEKRKLIEQENDNTLYVLYCIDRLNKGDKAPINVVADRIDDIIINKRKLIFTNELEQSIYKDALERNEFELFL